MNRIAATLGLCAALAFGAGAAQAGTCSAEIMALQKQITGTPTMASSGTTDADPGPAPLPAPDAATPAPGATLGASPSADAGGGEIAHAAPSGSGEAASTPGTDPLPDASGGTLAQGGKTVPAPAQSAPMDEDAAQVAELNTAAGADPDEAAKALARARAFDQAGDEAACMNAVAEAKSRLGR